MAEEANKVLSKSDVKNQIGKCLPKEKDDKQPQLPVVEEKDTQVGGIAVDRLRSLIERIERLEEETKALSGDIRDIFAEAKSAGFDVKIMRTIIKLRKMNAADRDEQEFLLDTYKKALDI